MRWSLIFWVFFVGNVCFAKNETSECPAFLNYLAAEAQFPEELQPWVQRLGDFYLSIRSDSVRMRKWKIRIELLKYKMSGENVKLRGLGSFVDRLDEYLPAYEGSIYHAISVFKSDLGEEYVPLLLHPGIANRWVDFVRFAKTVNVPKFFSPVGLLNLYKEYLRIKAVDID